MSKKCKLVISDLHVGAGCLDRGNLLDDFDQDEAFGRWLADCVAESERESLEMELILAGDAFEFLQVPSLPSASAFDPAHTYPPEDYASSSEVDSARKMRLILAGHPLFFSALCDFIQPTLPRRSVTVLKGNHDVELHWRVVQQVLRTALEATGERAACLTFEERRIAREGIYVEHGNQYAEQVNRFVDFEEPHDPELAEQLDLPAGSRFVYEFFNEIEGKHYWMDGVKPLTALVWYTFAYDFPLAVRELLTLLKLAPSLIWGSLPFSESSLALKPQADLLEELADARHLDTIQKDEALRRDFFERVEAALSLYGQRRRYGMKGATGRESPLARGLAEELAQEEALAGVARQKRDQEAASVIVFGHTHRACVVPLEGATYLNAGTWTWLRDLGGEHRAVWKDLFEHPEKYTNQRRLTAVRIDYDEMGAPSGQLLELSEEEPPVLSFWQRVASWLRGRIRRRK